MPLMPVIARTAWRPYLRAMASALFRLLAFVAVLLMPLGMATRPAAAAQPASAAGHCDEHQEPVDAPAAPKPHCTGCAALPADEAPEAIADLRPKAPMLLALADFRAGVEPDTITPPPKLS